MQKQFFLFAPLCAALVFCAVLLSCSDNTSINKVMGSGSEAPIFIAYRAESGTEIKFQFSMPVKIVHAFLNTGDDFEPFPDEYAPIISLRFVSDHSGGKAITADLLVEDADGNSLNVLVPFKTRNSRMPALLINEIRFERGGSNNSASEFIEFHTKTSGNLGAMRLFVASAKLDDPLSEPVYEFPSVEVKAGEYITLHMRTLPEDKAIDELGDNLNLAKAKREGDTNDSARDLWLPGSVKLLHSNADVIYLLDQDDVIIDSVVVAKSQDEWNKNKNLSKAAEFLAKQGAWLNAEGEAVKSPKAADAANTNNTTATRTLCRYETKTDSNKMDDWYICKGSGDSPGALNNPEVYKAASKSSAKQH
ncbi:MAG: hypothetical protein LBH18_05610 [Spirochaetaceae bacterium]|jgi:hypothetical protein|nr:hypothetical protein [Spirochaetaceae bacterium]